MIRRRRKVAGEFSRQACGLLASWGVHDGGTACRVPEQLASERGALRRGNLHRLNREIPAPEAVDKSCHLRQRQLLGDVVLHQRRGGRGQRDDRCRTEGWQMLAEPAVVRPKIMAPLRDAVGLVDGDQGRFPFRKHLRETGQAQPLRRNKQKLQRPVEVIDAGLT